MFTTHQIVLSHSHQISKSDISLDHQPQDVDICLDTNTQDIKNNHNYALDGSPDIIILQDIIIRILVSISHCLFLSPNHSRTHPNICHIDWNFFSFLSYPASDNILPDSFQNNPTSHKLIQLSSIVQSLMDSLNMLTMPLQDLWYHINIVAKLDNLQLSRKFTRHFFSFISFIFYYYYYFFLKNFLQQRACCVSERTDSYYSRWAQINLV